MQEITKSPGTDWTCLKCTEIIMTPGVVNVVETLVEYDILEFALKLPFERS